MPEKQQPIAWFFDRVGQDIKRGTTSVTVTKDNYMKLYELQSTNYTFTGNPVIHSSDNKCESCEG